MKGTGTELYQHLFLVYFSPSLTYEIKGKDKAVSAHSIKAYGEKQHSSTLSSTSNSIEMSGQLHDTATSLSGEKTPGTHTMGNSVWLFWRQERYHALARSRTPYQPVQSLVTILTEMLSPNIRTYINISLSSNTYTSLCLSHTIKHITVSLSHHQAHHCVQDMQYLFCTKNHT